MTSSKIAKDPSDAFDSDTEKQLPSLPTTATATTIPRESQPQDIQPSDGHRHHEDSSPTTIPTGRSRGLQILNWVKVGLVFGPLTLAYIFSPVHLKGAGEEGGGGGGAGADCSTRDLDLTSTFLVGHVMFLGGHIINKALDEDTYLSKAYCDSVRDVANIIWAYTCGLFFSVLFSIPHSNPSGASSPSSPQHA